jgi:hypothetical protein
MVRKFKHNMQNQLFYEHLPRPLTPLTLPKISGGSTDPPDPRFRRHRLPSRSGLCHISPDNPVFTVLWNASCHLNEPIVVYQFPDPWRRVDIWGSRMEEPSTLQGGGRQRHGNCIRWRIPRYEKPTSALDGSYSKAKERLQTFLGWKFVIMLIFLIYVSTLAWQYSATIKKQWFKIPS